MGIPTGLPFLVDALVLRPGKIWLVLFQYKLNVVALGNGEKPSNLSLDGFVKISGRTIKSNGIYIWISIFFLFRKLTRITTRRFFVRRLGYYINRW